MPTQRELIFRVARDIARALISSKLRNIDKLTKKISRTDDCNLDQIRISAINIIRYHAYAELCNIVADNDQSGDEAYNYATKHGNNIKGLTVLEHNIIRVFDKVSGHGDPDCSDLEPVLFYMYLTIAFLIYFQNAERMISYLQKMASLAIARPSVFPELDSIFTDLLDQCTDRQFIRTIYDRLEHTLFIRS